MKISMVYMVVITFKRHRILDHCDFDDVAKLEKLVEGISIKGKHDMSNQECDICTHS